MSSNKYFLNSYNVLFNIFKNNAYSNIELNNMLEDLADEKDKPLITRLVYGVLETNIELEYIIGQFASKKPKLATYIILKMGAYASIYLNGIPNYAIVNELVDLTKLKSKKQEAGFVNKVLKNIIDKKYEMPKKQDYFKYLSVKYSYPLWLLKKLNRQYGLKTLEKLISYKKNSLTHIRINKNLTNMDSFIKILEQNEIIYRNSVYPDALFVKYSKIKQVKNLANLYAVQSLGSMLIVNSLAVKNGSLVLDACAAPGGKTCYIAQQNSKGTVTALDIHEHRVELINSYANKLALKNVIPKMMDSTKLNEEFLNKFDYVLCDVPCSGIGVVSKKPDILLFKNEENVKDISKLQYDILSINSKYVKTNGILVYSTCTLLKEENIDIINKFLKENKNFELTKIEMPEINNIKIKKTITLLPDKINSEGYFITRMKKNENIT